MSDQTMQYPIRPVKRYSVVDDPTGLPFGYRFRWRFIYIASSIYGPANRQGSLDPRKQLRHDRAVHLLAGYRREGKQPPAELLALAEQ